MADQVDSDDIWGSASAKQIRALGNVEKEIAQLLQQAAAIMELQRIPRAGEQPMPKEQWEALITREATAYFDKLDSIQKQLRRVLVDMRARRMTPSSLNVASMKATASGLGTATLPIHTPSNNTPPQSFIDNPPVPPSSTHDLPNMNFQEARLERDAWRGIADALSKLRTLQQNGPNCL